MLLCSICSYYTLVIAVCSLSVVGLNMSCLYKVFGVLEVLHMIYSDDLLDHDNDIIMPGLNPKNDLYFYINVWSCPITNKESKKKPQRKAYKKT